MVKASERLTRVIADNGKAAWMFKKFGVSSMPTIIFIGADGKEIEKLKGRDAAAVAKQFNDVADKHTRAPKWSESQEKGLETAKTDGLPAILYFHDSSPKSQAAEKAFGELALSELLAKFTWSKVAMDWKSDEAKKLGLTGPALWVIDPKLEDPMAKPLKKIGLPKAGTGLKSELGPIVKSWKAEPAPAPPKKDDEEKKEESK